LKILFTSIGRRVELMQLYRKAADNLNIDLTLYGSDIDEKAPALYFCDKTVISPKISDPSYLDFLKDFCEKESIDALVSTIDTDLLLLSKHKNEFGKTKIFISQTDKVMLCRDKRLTADYFNSVGLKSPAPVDDVAKYNAGFPAFIKPKDGSSSIKAYKVQNEMELTALAKQVPDYIVQPYIDGTEYTVDIFCDYDGNPIFITPRIRLSVRAGEVLKTQICQDEQIIEEMKTLIADYKPCGAITVQLIKEKSSGENYYIEINPRFGGGVPLSMYAGANSAEMMLRILNGEKIDYCPNAAEDGAVYSRFDQAVRIR